jgi:hypothetical protein
MSCQVAQTEGRRVTGGEPLVEGFLPAEIRPRGGRGCRWGLSRLTIERPQHERR